MNAFLIYISYNLMCNNLIIFNIHTPKFCVKYEYPVLLVFFPIVVLCTLFNLCVSILFTRLSSLILINKVLQIKIFN